MQNVSVSAERTLIRASLRERRALAAALVASIGLHAVILVLIALPAVFETPRAPTPLEVVIVQAPRPLPVAEETRPRTPPPAKPTPRPERPNTTQAERADTPRPAEPRAVLALPVETPAAPAFTVQQGAADTPPSPPEPKVAAAPRDAGPGTAVATTPASFNAAYLRNEPPRYPPSARRSGIEGRVNLKVVITREGRPAQVQVHESSGSSALDNAAVEAVRNWQFVPARRGQEPIESSVIVPIVFKLEKSG